MNLFDLHCDTAFELYQTKSALFSNKLSVSIDKYRDYEKKAQVFAVWSDKNKTDDEAFLDFQHIAANFRDELVQNAENAVLCTSAETLENAGSKLCAILSVEDARLLGNNLSRLERLYENGVRILTLAWEGKTCVGGGYDTEEGLTDFGFAVLAECEKLGITVDVSHLSEKGFWDVAGKATRPFIASHSNSVSLCSHRRNLTDTQFRTIANCGGSVGVSLVAKHLSAALEHGELDENAVYETVCSHIEHFLEMDAKHVCLGMDFDGTAPIHGLENVSLAGNIAKALSNRGCEDSTVGDVFYGNAYRFFADALKN